MFPDAKLVVVTESDLTGNRVAAAGEGRKLPAKRRNQVDPLALVAGDSVVHDQHGIGRFVEMVERTIGSKRGTGGSAGAAYLRETVGSPVFPDLWEIRLQL